MTGWLVGVLSLFDDNNDQSHQVGIQWIDGWMDDQPQLQSSTHNKPHNSQSNQVHCHILHREMSTLW